MDLQKLFSVVLNMSLTGSIVILIVLLCRLLLRKAPKVFSYALWSIVLFRLLCPVSVSSALSVFNVAKAMAADPVGMVTVVRHPAVSDVLPEQILEMSEPSRGEPIYSGSEEPQDAAPIPYPAYVWLFGVAAMTAYSIHSCRKLNRKLFGAVHLRENLYLADDIPSPFVLGLIRPRIYLPASLAESEQTYIIAHERHHIVRKDNLWKLLAFGAMCVHWFNPLVWLAFSLAGKDMEMSCDEAVIRQLGAEIRADYSASLLRLSVGHRFPAGTPLAFGEGDTKGRVMNMANWKKPKKWVNLCAAVLCIGVLGACAMNPVAQTEPTQSSVPPIIVDETPPKVLTSNGAEKLDPQWLQNYDSPVKTITIGETSVHLYALAFMIPEQILADLVNAHPDAAEIHVYKWNGYLYDTYSELQIESMAKGCTEQVNAIFLNDEDYLYYTGMGYFTEILSFTGPAEESDCNSRVYWTRFYGNTPEEPDHLPLAVDKLPKWYEKCDGWIEYSTDYQIS